MKFIIFGGACLPTSNQIRVLTIEIIDIECVLLSFLNQKFVATKWPILAIYKGFFYARLNLPWQGISRCCRDKAFLKSSKSRFKLKKVRQRRYLLSKIHLSGFFKKTISFGLAKVTLKSLKQPFLGSWQTLKSKYFPVFMKNI